MFWLRHVGKFVTQFKLIKLRLFIHRYYGTTWLLGARFVRLKKKQNKTKNSGYEYGTRTPTCILSMRSKVVTHKEYLTLLPTSSYYNFYSIGSNSRYFRGI